MRPMHGLSLVELMIALVILSLVLAKGLPAIADYVRNDRIRSAAEEMRDGLQTAKLEAIRRNTTVNFVRNGTGWSVVVPGVAGAADTVVIQRPPMAREAMLLATAATNTVSFTGSGRLSTAGGLTLDVSSPPQACAAQGGDARCLRVTATTGGAIRLCDPALPGSNPQGC